MSHRLKIAAGIIAVLAMMSVTGLALAASNDSSSSSATGSATPQAATALGLFRVPIADPNIPSEQVELKARVVDAEDNSLPLGQADFSQARPVTIPASSAKVWVIPSGERACIVIVKVESWGAGCPTIAQVDAGEGLSEMVQRGGQAIVVDVTADGAAGPTLIDPEGKTTTLTAESNVSDAILPAGDQIQTPTQTIALAP